MASGRFSSTCARGSLQEASGPSVAFEFGRCCRALSRRRLRCQLRHNRIPTLGLGNDPRQRRCRAHADHHADFFLGGIIEGPGKWKVRRLLNSSIERKSDRPRTVSGLVVRSGSVKDNLSFERGLSSCRREWDSGRSSFAPE